LPLDTCSQGFKENLFVVVPCSSESKFWVFLSLNSFVLVSTGCE